MSKDTIADLNAEKLELLKDGETVIEKIRVETRKPERVHSKWITHEDLQIEDSIELFNKELHKFNSLIKKYDALHDQSNPASIVQLENILNTGLNLNKLFVDYLDARLKMMETGYPSREFNRSIKPMKACLKQCKSIYKKLTKSCK